jgi:arylsulfatase A-like enzyme
VLAASPLAPMQSAAPKILLREDRAQEVMGRSTYRTGLFPAFALLGIALPVAALSWIDRSLHYLRPLELIPTYATAWLLLATFVIPFAAACSLLLKIPYWLPKLRWLRGGCATLLEGVAAAAIVTASVYAVEAWLRTFGPMSDIHLQKGLLLVFSLFAAALITMTDRGRKALNRFYHVAKYGTVLGALSLTCLPFTGWSHAARPLPVDQFSAAANRRSKPHILLVTIDALSAEHMSLYGASRETTPNLETFAQAATTFDHAYANANFTTPGISSILTATRPWTHRALQLPAWPTADARHNSLPALLSEAGYRETYVATNIFASPVKNGLGAYFDAGSGDHIRLFSFCSDGLSAILPYDCAAAALPVFAFTENLWNKISWRLIDPSSNWHHDPRLASRSALEELAAADRSKPMFLWVHFMAPHAPYAAPAPWLGQFDSSKMARDAAHSESETAFLFANVPEGEARVLHARYDESIRYVDHYVGEFLTRALQLLGDNTVVILTADHGESFEHGYGVHCGPALFEPLIHIPLIIKLPYQKRESRTSLVVEQVDIGPTLAELTGFTPPASWEGRSLVGLLDSEAEAPLAPKPAFAMNFEQNPSHSALTTGSIAVIDGRWKLIHYTGRLHYELMPPLHDELYDVEADPGELTNRIATEPGEAEHLHKLIAAELSLHGSAVP